MHFLRRAIAALSVVTTLLGEGWAAAQTPEPPDDGGLRLEYQAPDGCPDAAAFRAEVRARNRRVRGGERVEGDLSVRMTASGRHVSGSLEVRSGGRLVGTREVEGESCRDVASALSLAAALDLDAAAVQRTPPPSTEVPEAPPEPSPPAPPPPPRAWRLAVGAHASVQNGVADGLLFGVPVFVELASRLRGLVSPSARLWVEVAESGTVDEAVGALRFLWLAAGLEACPVRLGPSTFALEPCVGLEAGALRASPEGVAFGHAVTEPWLAGLAVGRMVWEPTRVLFFEIEGGLRVPFLRPQFVFLPGAVLYEVPPLSVLGEAGLGLHFL